MGSRVLKHYDAFYNMTLITTMLTNVFSENYEEDAKHIILLVGKAYGLKDNEIYECEKYITDTFMDITTVSDANTFNNSQSWDSNGGDDEVSLKLMKCEIVLLINDLAKNNSRINGSWFDYYHYKPYTREIRFNQIAQTATTGNLIANKVAAVMLYLGIGTSKDEKSAVLRLKQCALWGDVFSMYLLSLILKDKNDADSQSFAELSSLEKYLNEGRTLLPEEAKKIIGERTRQLFACISSIRQDIILLHKVYDIDYSFVEVLLQPTVDYYKKLYYINNYSAQEWKEVTHSSINPNSKIGFKVGRN